MFNLWQGKKKAHAVFAVAVLLLFCVGCTDDTLKEVKELRKEVAQLKAEVHGMRRSIERRAFGEMESRFVHEDERAMFRTMNDTNGIRRVYGTRTRPSHEEMGMRHRRKGEHRRKMDERRKSGKGFKPLGLGGASNGADAGEQKKPDAL